MDSRAKPMDTPYSSLLLEETASTQDDAKSCYDGKPVLVVAAGQTAGRGRTGAGWLTAPRAMAASLAFEPDLPPDRLTLVPLLAGLAAGRVIDVDLKWPNDLLAGGGKVGGILVEASDGLVVAGFGLNLWWPQPPSGVAGLYAEDPGAGERVRIAEDWARQLLRLVAVDPWPRDEYRARCVTLGRRITWRPEGKGIAVDVADDGALVVEMEEGVERLRSGEVRHVRAG